MAAIPQIKGLITTKKVEGDRLHIGGSVKITSKMEPDHFVSVESSCSLSVTVGTGKLDAVTKQTTQFVQGTIMRNLERQIAKVKEATTGG